MSLVTTGDLVAAASARGKAVAAVNVITLEHAEAIVAAAAQRGRSLVLQLSENAIAYHGGPHAITRAVHALADDAPMDLAVAVGSSHAMTEQKAHLDHHLIERIADRVPVPLVLHGSSGVPDEDLRRAVAAGIRKVNVGTALNVALTSSLRATLAVDPSVTDPRRYLAPARTAMRDVVVHLLDLVG